MSSCGVQTGTTTYPNDPSNDIILSAVGVFGGIDVTWSYPGTNPHAIQYTKVYRSSSNDPATMVWHQNVNGSHFYDKVSSTVTYYYWIRWVSINGTEGDLIGPSSATAKPPIEHVINGLAGRVLKTHLSTSLNTEVDKIPTLRTDLDAEVTARLNDYDNLTATLNNQQTSIDNTNALIIDEQTVRKSEDDALAASINGVSVKADDNNALILQEQKVRADADSALGSRIDTILVSNVATYRQDTAPDPAVVVLNPGDLWINTTQPTDGSEPKYPVSQWDGVAWIPVEKDWLMGAFASLEAEQMARIDRDGQIAQTTESLEVSLGKKVRTYSQLTAPAGTTDDPLVAGDLWIDTDDKNRLYRWDGAAWVDATDKAKIQVYRQTTAPTGANAGDLWFDSDDSDKSYRWSGSAWEPISLATNTAVNAVKDYAAGKIKVYRQNLAPAGTADMPLAVGDLWFDTDDGDVAYQWDGAAWQAIDLATNGAVALVEAIANSKVKVYRQTTAPAGTTDNPLTDGDLWFDTDDNDRIYRWNANLATPAWEEVKLATRAHVSASIVDNNRTQIGYCNINGSPSNDTDAASCEANGGTWVMGTPLAEATKRVQVSDGGQTAALEQVFQAHKNTLGGLETQWTLKTDVNGHVAGIGLANTPSEDDGTNTSRMIVNVDEFALTHPSNIWQANTAYTVGKFVRPTTTKTGFIYECTAAVDGADTNTTTTSGTTEPVWPTTLTDTNGNPTTVTDGELTWTTRQPAERVPFIVTDNTVYIRETVIQSLTFSKLRSEAGDVMFKPAEYDASGNMIKDSQLKVAHLDVTNLTVRSARSDNYVAGSSGWTLNPDGTAELLGIKARGDIEATSLNADALNIVGNGHIADAAVDTLQLAGQAVIIPEAIYYSGSQSLGPADTYGVINWTTTASRQITFTNANTTSGIIVSGGFDLLEKDHDGSLTCSWRIRRGTTVLASGDLLLVNAGDVGGSYTHSQAGTFSKEIVDSPGSGTHTYYLDVYISGAPYNTYCYVAHRYLNLTGAKR